MVGTPCNGKVVERTAFVRLAILCEHYALGRLSQSLQILDKRLIANRFLCNSVAYYRLRCWYVGIVIGLLDERHARFLIMAYQRGRSTTAQQEAKNDRDDYGVTQVHRGSTSITHDFPIVTKSTHLYSPYEIDPKHTGS